MAMQREDACRVMPRIQFSMNDLLPCYRSRDATDLPELVMQRIYILDLASCHEFVSVSRALSALTRSS